MSKSREVLSQGDIDRLKERLSHRSLNHPPKLGSFGEVSYIDKLVHEASELTSMGKYQEDAEEQPASAERTIQEKKSLSKAPEYLDLTPLMHEGRLRMDYSSSEDADSEMPESSPIRGLRKKRVSTCSRVKDNSVATQDKDENTVEQDEYHLMIRTDPSGKTTFPFVSKRSATQSARNSRIQNKNTPRPRSVTSSSSLSPSPKAPTENPLPAGPHSDKYPDSARTVPAKRMSAGRPPIPYRSSKRFASSPSHATRPHLNTKIAPPSPSVGPQGEMSTTSENSDTPTPGGKLSKGTKVAHITPRNAGAMSKIPRASPLSLAPTTAGNGTPDSSAKSPVYVNRRSSIPVPRRLIQTNANIPENTAENGSSAINEDKPGEECGIKDEEYTDDDGSDDIKLYQASEMSIVKIEGSDVEHSYGKGGDSSDQDNGYRVKRLSLSGRGPTLRISAFADRVIMGRGLEKGKTPMEKLKANNERRRSWNPKEFGSKESSISTPSIKSMLSPRPNSSIGSASKKDKFGDGIETESSLKKAKSVDLLSPASSLSSPGSGSQRLEMRKASKSSLFKSDHVTRKPSPLREGFGASTPASRKSPRTPTIKEETPQQTPLSRIATRSERTPAENRGVSTSKDGIKKDDSPSARRVAKLAENKNGTVTSPKGIAGKSKPPNTLSKEHPPRSSSRNKTTDHTLNAKSKLAHVKNASSVSNAPSTGNKPEAIEPAEFGMNNDPVPDVNRNSVAADSTKTRTSTAKNSLSRGMLSNFKGFFGKQKSGIPESSTSASLRPKLSSTLKSKASKETKATTSATGATLPSERSTRFRSGRGRPTISSPIRFPDLEFPGNGDVNALTRDILDSAQRETDSAVKLRLIRVSLSQ